MYCIALHCIALYWAGCDQLLVDSILPFCAGPIWLVNNTRFNVAKGTILFALNRSAWIKSGYPFNTSDCCYPAVINGEGLSNVSLTGGGTIDGDGHEWWETVWANNDTYRPHLTGWRSMEHLRIGGGLELRNSPNHHIWVEDSVQVRIGGVAGELTIFAPAAPESSHSRKSSPNTDGINIAGGFDTLIESVRIHNNDDCISVVASGGWPPGSKATLGNGGNVIVKNITCEFSHGLSIGSVTEGVVRNVTFEGCAMHHSDNGVRVKTHANGTGLISDIVFRDIIMKDVIYPLFVTGNYGSGAPTNERAVLIENVTLQNIRGSGYHGGYFHCTEVQRSPGGTTIPQCTGILLQNISLAPAFPIKNIKMSCENAHGFAENVHPPSCLVQTPN